MRYGEKGGAGMKMGNFWTLVGSGAFFFSFLGGIDGSGCFFFVSYDPSFSFLLSPLFRSYILVMMMVLLVMIAYDYELFSSSSPFRILLLCRVFVVFDDSICLWVSFIIGYINMFSYSPIWEKLINFI